MRRPNVGCIGIGKDIISDQMGYERSLREIKRVRSNHLEILKNYIARFLDDYEVAKQEGRVCVR